MDQSNSHKKFISIDSHSRLNKTSPNSTFYKTKLSLGIRLNDDTLK